MTIEKTWNDFVGGKIDYQNFSDHGWVMAVDAAAETYDVIIGERELLDDGNVDPAKIYRGIKSSIPFSVIQFAVGDPVLVGYVQGNRNRPLVIGASDNIIMDVSEVEVNPLIALYVSDASNHRIKKHDPDDWSYMDQVGSFGSGDDQLNSPKGVVIDGTHCYIMDSGNHRLIKRLKSDLSFVAKIGSGGSGDDQFSSPYGICCDATYLYIADRLNHRIVKRLKSDLSFVAKLGSLGSGNDQFNTPSDIITDGTYLYIEDRQNFRSKKHLASDLSYVDQNSTYRGRLTTDGVNLYVCRLSNIHKLTFSFGLVASYSVLTGDTVFGVTTDGVNLWVAIGGYTIQKRALSDLATLVSQISAFGSGNDSFNGIEEVEIETNYSLLF